MYRLAGLCMNTRSKWYRYHGRKGNCPSLHKNHPGLVSSYLLSSVLADVLNKYSLWRKFG